MLGFNPLYTAALQAVGGGPSLVLAFSSGSGFPPGLTFSRGTNATQFNSAGQLVWAPANLICHSNDFGNSATWTTINANTSVTLGVADAPSGTSFTTCSEVTGVSGIAGYFGKVATNNRALVTGGTYVATFWAKSISGSTTLGAYGGSASSTVTLNTSWVKYTTGSFTSTNTIPAIYLDSTGVFRIAGVQFEFASVDSPRSYVETTTSPYYGPRLDYNPATLAPRGLLVEAQRTNLCPTSTSFSGTMASISAGATIIGWSSQRAVADGVSGMHFASAPATASALNAASVYTVSVFVKGVTATRAQLTVPIGMGAATCYVNFNLTTGAVVGSGAGATARGSINCGGGVWRLWMQFTSVAVPAASSAAIVGFITADGDTQLPVNTSTDSLDCFGAQLEAGAFASSLMPTFGAAATRNGDVADLAYAPPWNPLGTSFYADFERQGAPIASSTEATSSLFYFGDGANGVSGVFGYGIPMQVRCDMFASSVSEAQPTGSTQCVAFQVYKWATRHAPNASKMYSNGAAGTSDVVVTMPAALGTSRYSIGRSNSASTQQMHGWLRELRVYNTALTDTQLQALTV